MSVAVLRGVVWWRLALHLIRFIIFSSFSFSQTQILQRLFFSLSHPLSRCETTTHFTHVRFANPHRELSHTHPCCCSGAGWLSFCSNVYCRGHTQQHHSRPRCTHVRFSATTRRPHRATLLRTNCGGSGLAVLATHGRERLRTTHGWCAKSHASQ